MQASQSVDHAVLALYGFAKTTEATSHFYDLALGWCSKLTCQPSRLGIGTGKLIDFKRGDKKLRASGFADIKALNIISVPEQSANYLDGYSTNWILDWNLPEAAVIDFCSMVLQICSPEFESLCHEAIKSLAPAYGYAYTRPFNLGPAFYAVGLSHGSDSFAEKLFVSQSFESIREKLYAHGVLRVLCPWNFLNESHLAATIEGQRLRDWIRGDRRRGSLTPFGNLTLWRVDETEIEKLNKPLSDAHILFDYERDIVAKMGELGAPQRDVAERLRSGKPLPRETHTMDVTASSAEEAMRLAMQAFGYTDPEEVDILKVEKPGQARQLSDAEKSRLFQKSSKDPNRNDK